MFSQARKAGLDMDMLGDQMRARKAQLMETFERDGLPPPETRSFTGHDLEEGEPVDDEADTSMSDRPGDSPRAGQ